MNTIALGERRNWDSVAEKSLQHAATFWFLVTVIGQMLFVVYILGFYGSPTLHGNFEAWSRNKALPHGYVPGDTIGNLQFAAHVLLAAVMCLGGVLQLVPKLRARVPAIHRWNGRVFVSIAVLLALGGLYMVWISGRMNHVFGGIAISLNAILILVFAALALRYARAREFNSHRRWALRLFIVANGVWFMRIGYMAWVIVNQGPRGIAVGQTGLFDLFWSLGCFLLPLAILEVYLRAKERGARNQRFIAAVGLFVATVLMATGIGGAYMFMWHPLLS
jgi:uncharacterized membrane protein